jgi:hypothetical protein
METKPFSQPSLDEVSGHSVPETLLHHHPQAMVWEFIISKVYPEMGSSYASTGLFHPQKAD